MDYFINMHKFIHAYDRKEKDSGAWIRTMDLRVMSPSGFPDYPTPLPGKNSNPPLLKGTDKVFGNPSYGTVKKYRVKLMISKSLECTDQDVKIAQISSGF